MHKRLGLLQDDGEVVLDADGVEGARQQAVPRLPCLAVGAVCEEAVPRKSGDLEALRGGPHFGVELVVLQHLRQHLRIAGHDRPLIVRGDVVDAVLLELDLLLRKREHQAHRLAIRKGAVAEEVVGGVVHGVRVGAALEPRRVADDRERRGAGRDALQGRSRGRLRAQAGATDSGDENHHVAGEVAAAVCLTADNRGKVGVRHFLLRRLHEEADALAQLQGSAYRRGKLLHIVSRIRDTDRYLPKSQGCSRLGAAISEDQQVELPAGVVCHGGVQA
mmetsp:Transcript_23070/g.57947  ORF Transcript_23070/g.57947 Transcript_23070/m.57947 type:complete len:276 (-) Transcript_23070:56-883(-)